MERHPFPEKLAEKYAQMNAMVAHKLGIPKSDYYGFVPGTNLNNGNAHEKSKLVIYSWMNHSHCYGLHSIRLEVVVNLNSGEENPPNFQFHGPWHSVDSWTQDTWFIKEDEAIEKAMRILALFQSMID